jgi:hypothetical protein
MKSTPHFNSASSILTELREVSTHEGTIALLSELFFEFALHQLESDPPLPARIRQLRDLRYDVLRLFELAKAAKEMKLK